MEASDGSGLTRTRSANQHADKGVEGIDMENARGIVGTLKLCCYVLSHGKKRVIEKKKTSLLLRAQGRNENFDLMT